MLMALRHPVLLAQMVGTVDLISGGRLQLGVGVGGAFNAMQQAEWRNAQVNQRTRAPRLEEMLQVIKGLGREEPYSFAGRHFDLDDVVMQPTPVQSGGVPGVPGRPLAWARRRPGRAAGTAGAAGGAAVRRDYLNLGDAR